MATDQLGTLLGHLRSLVASEATHDLTDNQLVAQFADRRDHIAFTELVRRHGQLVWGLCRRVLGHDQDAEEAFQATFLALAFKAASLAKIRALGSWLHRAAYLSAMHIKRQTGRRRVHEQKANRMLPKTDNDLACRELQAVLDEELQRLPEKYRAPFVLCCLEGQSGPEAARQLGCKEGTVSGRLAQARKKLQQRLARRGFTLTGVLCAGALSRQAASAGVPAAVASATVRAALLVAGGRLGGAAGAGAVSAKVDAAMKGVIKAMIANKTRIATALLLACGVVVAAGLLFQQALSGKPSAAKPTSVPKRSAPKLAESNHRVNPLPEGAVARLGSPRFRHEHDTAWLGAAFTHDGKMLATCGFGCIRLWESASGKLFRQIDGPFWLHPPLFSPNGKLLAVRGGVRENGFPDFALLNSATGKTIRRFPKGGWPLAFSPDGKLLVTFGGKEEGVRVWNALTGQPVFLLPGQPDLQKSKQSFIVHSAAFTPDGQTLVAASWSGKICRWDVATRKLRASVQVPLPQPQVRQACLSSDGRTLAVTPQNNQPVSLWATETGKQRCTLQGKGTAANFGLAFSADGKTLATDWAEPGSDRASISLWNAGTGKRIRRFRVPAQATCVLTFAPDGKRLLSSGSEPQVRLWDTATGKQLLKQAGHEGAITSLSFTPDGRTLASGSEDGAIQLWDVAAAREGRKVMGHRWGVNAVAVLPDGKTALTGGRDGCLRLQELDTGKQRKRFIIGEEPEELREPRYDVRCLGLSADGRTAASWSTTVNQEEALFHVWDLATGKVLIRRLDVSGFGRRFFLPDAKLVLSYESRSTRGDSTGGGSARTRYGGDGADLPVLREVATGKQLCTLPQPDNSAYVQAFAPDGRTVATVTFRRTIKRDRLVVDKHAIRVWELATAKERLTILSRRTGYEFRFERVALAPDGRCLATARADRTLLFWDLATGRELLRRTGYSAGVRCLAFTADGKRLASGHTDGTILLWDVSSQAGRKDRPAKHLLPKQLEECWTDLASADAPKAHAAIWGLSAVPRQAVTLLRDKLHPAPVVPPDMVRQLIADLASNQYKRRKAAYTRLEDFDKQAHPMLQAALKANPSAEPRRLLETLLAEPGRIRSGVVLRHLRAVEVLEHIGRPEARKLLMALARGAAKARLTREAKASLKRLAK